MNENDMPGDIPAVKCKCYICRDWFFQDEMTRHYDGSLWCHNCEQESQSAH